MNQTVIRLLLEILEQEEPQVSGRSLHRNVGVGAEALVRSGALQRVAPETPQPDPRWHDSDELAFEGGWADPLTGAVVSSVAVEGPAPDRSIYRFSFEWLFGSLAEGMALVNIGRRSELVPDHAWDIGELWVDRRRKAPILFGRRLSRADIAEPLRGALERRSGRSGGLILTSSRLSRGGASWPAAHKLVDLAEVLVAGDRGLGIDLALLKGFYTGHPPEGLAVGPVYLAPDGRSLRIHDEEFLFRGVVHIAIVRQLVDAYAHQRQARTRDVLQRAGSQADTLTKAFSGYPGWHRLKKYIGYKQGFCWLDV